ncbi:hypothetical protein GZ22_17255 [Terribacillus saccharophilus]|uniref:Uncharacterized protein n=1 Tax=Terribacillus saccharophilus TaxID=361277 RepID=A0A075LNB7_9BACI|nr:hypothetical protein [Terribacillus goriensis]AIF68205.1 hypothetical protein GZ22_17255 [Terribacillus goriensis]
MPNWMLIHGILLVILGCLYFFVYYNKSWTLSAPFNKKTSMKILFLYLLPLCWLLSSVLLGITFYYFGLLKSVDVIFLVILPILTIIISGVYYWLSNKSYIKQQEQTYKDIDNFKKVSMKWIKQFSFVNDNNIDLEVYISKGTPKGRMIIYDLTTSEENLILKQHENIPLGLTIMTSKKNGS